MMHIDPAGDMEHPARADIHHEVATEGAATGKPEGIRVSAEVEGNAGRRPERKASGKVEDSEPTVAVAEARCVHFRHLQSSLMPNSAGRRQAAPWIATLSDLASPHHEDDRLASTGAWT